MRITNDKDKIVILLPLNLYTHEVIFKCLYWYLDNFTFEVNYLNDVNLEIILRNRDGLIDVSNNFENIKNKIEQDLFDFKLRHIISTETGNIRDLLIAKAFNPITKK